MCVKVRVICGADVPPLESNGTMHIQYVQVNHGIQYNPSVCFVCMPTAIHSFHAVSCSA